MGLRPEVTCFLQDVVRAPTEKDYSPCSSRESCDRGLQSQTFGFWSRSKGSRVWGVRGLGFRGSEFMHASLRTVLKHPLEN